MFRTLVKNMSEYYNNLIEKYAKPSAMYGSIDTSAATSEGWANRQAILYTLKNQK